MSRPMADTPKRRPRRQFTDEFKAGAVRLVLDDGKTVGAAARDLDLTETALREWVKRARADWTQGRTGLTTAEREELARLRKENRELRTERDILKKAAAFFAKHQAQGSPGSRRRRPTSRWPSVVARCASPRAVSTPGNSDRSRTASDATGSSGRSFARRMRRATVAMAGRACGRTCTRRASMSVKGVGRLMREEGLRARARKRFRSTTMSEHYQPVAANVLARQFAAERPNQRWVGDTTEFVIGSSAKLYLAAILDLYSRFIVGWAVSAVNDRHLTLRALEMALKRRGPEAGLLHHSDQGCTYASEDYRARLKQYGITCSMSRRGNCYDNAVIESWFSTVKSEEGERFESYSHAKQALFDYIEVFYNQRRRHSTLGQISPAEFERRAARRVDPVENRQERGFPPAPHDHLLIPEKNEERKAINLRQPSTESDQADSLAAFAVRGSESSSASKRLRSRDVLFDKLGKHKTGKVCVYIRRLATSI